MELPLVLLLLQPLVFSLSPLIAGKNLVSALSIVTAGATIGFLMWNKSPAKIYMGDAGALFLGIIISVATIRLNPGITPTWQSLAIPVMLLAVPLLDTCVAVFLTIGSWVVTIDRWQGSSFTSLSSSWFISPSSSGFIVVCIRSLCSYGCWGLSIRRFFWILADCWLCRALAFGLGAVSCAPHRRIKTFDKHFKSDTIALLGQR
jgi:UDP-N-acetylmuramyl pentapeptide phosphotransferase/UDP-N-acetylglucosamine-1-phosphate transferase